MKNWFYGEEIPMIELLNPNRSIFIIRDSFNKWLKNGYELVKLGKTRKIKNRYAVKCHGKLLKDKP